MYKEAVAKAAITNEKSVEYAAELKNATATDVRLTELVKNESHAYNTAKHNARMASHLKKARKTKEVTSYRKVQIAIANNMEAYARGSSRESRALGDIRVDPNSKCQSGDGLMANGIFTTSHTPYGVSGMEFNSNL